MALESHSPFTLYLEAATVRLGKGFSWWMNTAWTSAAGVCSMIVKVLIVIVLFAILASLASGLFYLVHDKGRSQRTVKALTWRICLSLGLFILLMVGYALGIVKPHGITPDRPRPAPTTSEE
jgi:succinate dehydrogenase/fumarate reductase cytochrome b subunit